MAIFKTFMHRVNTPSHSQMLHLFQVAGEMSNSHMYKFPQNNLLVYSYYMIADISRKIHLTENRDKKYCSKIYIPRCKLILR